MHVLRPFRALKLNYPVFDNGRLADRFGFRYFTLFRLVNILFLKNLSECFQINSVHHKTITKKNMI